ncbi:MAG: amidase [Planctomycetota bacterium]|nr:amidase [Planctomycetota bacterium]
MIDRLEPINQTVKNIASGAIAPRHLVQFCLNRISRHDEVLQAWVRVDEQSALAEADRLEQMARRGKMRGPLHGIPIGVKDIIDVAGMPTVAGSPRRAHHVATRDSPLVSQLRRAGAIILGKTVTTQFAGFDPPPTRNPWNLSHTPGGSSSGSAAAVAAQMCNAAIGTQTGGSIVRPASYCGIAGLKPTYQAIDTSGVVPLSRTLDHPGPIARYVSDLAVLFRVLKQGRQAQPSAPAIAATPLLRIVKDFFMEEAAANVISALEPALARLRTAILTDNPFRLPQSFQTLHHMHRRIMAAEAAQVHRDEFESAAEQFAPCITELINEGLEMPAVEFAAALEHRALFRQAMRRQLDADTVLVMPATNTAAPPELTTTGDARFQSPWSYAGLPVVSIPAGKDPHGMPCSLQFVGAAGQDETVLAAAAWSENQLALDWQRPEPEAKRTT